MQSKPDKKLNITIVGPGMMPIPPKSWGAVEILIWNYKKCLESLGHKVKIVNTTSRQKIIKECNEGHCDFVHIHYDHYWDVIPKLKCHNIGITSHNPYLEQPEKFPATGFSKIHKGMISLNKDHRVRILALSRGIKQMYVEDGFDSYRVLVSPNGVEREKFNFTEECQKPDKSIYLGRIDGRKSQYKYCTIRSIDFAGRIDDKRFKPGKNHLGEWTKKQVYEDLTKYANLVLLSSAEAHPLVCMEALSAGLGLVVSPRCMAHLDIRQEFIDVIPFKKLDNINYVRDKIKQNREKSVKLRKEIREYSIKFQWESIISCYLEIARNTKPDARELAHYFPLMESETSFFQPKKTTTCRSGFGGFGMGQTE